MKCILWMFYGHFSFLFHALPSMLRLGSLGCQTEQYKGPTTSPWKQKSKSKWSIFSPPFWDLNLSNFFNLNYFGTGQPDSTTERKQLTTCHWGNFHRAPHSVIWRFMVMMSGTHDWYLTSSKEKLVISYKGHIIAVLIPLMGTLLIWLIKWCYCCSVSANPVYMSVGKSQQTESRCSILNEYIKKKK